jgi:hypothetical protein
MKLRSKIILQPCGCVGLAFDPYMMGIVAPLAEQGASFEEIHLAVEEAAKHRRLRMPDQRGPVE